MACKMLEECSVQEQQQSSALLESLQNQLDRLHTKLEGLRGMCAMGDITREEFLHDKQSIQSEIEHLHARIEDVSTLSLSPAPTLDMSQIKRTLDSWLDFSGPKISEELIEEFILQVVLINDNTFNWTLDLSSGIYIQVKLHCCNTGNGNPAAWIRYWIAHYRPSTSSYHDHNKRRCSRLLPLYRNEVFREKVAR